MLSILRTYSVDTRHFCDSVTLWVGKMSWLWVQGQTFVWQCSHSPSLYYLHHAIQRNSRFDAFRQLAHWFFHESERVLFHMLTTRHIQWLIRNPSQKRNLDLLSLSNTKHMKNLFKNWTWLYPEDGGINQHLLCQMSPKGLTEHSVNMSGSGRSLSLLFSGRQQHQYHLTTNEALGSLDSKSYVN